MLSVAASPTQNHVDQPPPLPATCALLQDSMDQIQRFKIRAQQQETAAQQAAMVASLSETLPPSQTRAALLETSDRIVRHSDVRRGQLHELDLTIERLMILQIRLCSD